MSNNGPTFTKATYDRKRLRNVPPSAERRAAAQALSEAECARGKELNKRPRAERISLLVEMALALKK